MRNYQQYKGEKFDILFEGYNNGYGNSKWYRANVEVTYRSDNIIRFTLKAGQKEIYLEKWLFRKRNQWKISGANFNPNYGFQSSARTLLNIQEIIDYKLKSIDEQKIG